MKRKLVSIAAALAVALPIAVAVSPVKVEAHSGCHAATVWSGSQVIGVDAWCDDLVQGPPGTFGEFVQSRESCSNQPSVWYYGPKRYNDGQVSRVLHTCPPGTETTFGLVLGTGA